MSRLFLALTVVLMLTLATAVPVFAAHGGTPGESAQCTGLDLASEVSGRPLSDAPSAGC